MSKRIVAILLVLVMAVCALPVCAFADSGGTASVTSVNLVLPSVTEITIRNPNNYNDKVVIYVDTDYVGFQFINTGSKVKACQAYTLACGSDPKGIDGIWGQNSETALRGAQQTMYNYGYTAVSSDGVCGPNTWRGFYGYCNGVPGSVRSAVFS